jgi:hypothetical protein
MPPRTKPSEGASSCEGPSLPSAIPDADSEHTASVPVQPIRVHSGCRTVDTQNRPANGRQPGTPGTQLRWQTVTGTRSGSSEMLGVPRPYTTPCGLLKQPDKQKVFSPGIWWCILFHRVEGGTMGQVLHPAPHLQDSGQRPPASSNRPRRQGGTRAVYVSSMSPAWAQIMRAAWILTILDFPLLHRPSPNFDPEICQHREIKKCAFRSVGLNGCAVGHPPPLGQPS